MKVNFEKYNSIITVITFERTNHKLSSIIKKFLDTNKKIEGYLSSPGRFEVYIGEEKKLESELLNYIGE